MTQAPCRAVRAPLARLPGRTGDVSPWPRYPRIQPQERCAVTTTSEISFAGDGQVTSDVLLLGAAGNSGRLIAAELAARRLSVRLAGRRRGPLEDLARALAADGATTDVRTVDVGDAASLAEAIVRRRGGPVHDRAVRPAGRPGDRCLPRRHGALCGHSERMVSGTGTARPRRASTRARGHAGHRGRVRAQPRPRHAGPAPGRADGRGAGPRACRGRRRR